MIQKEIYVTCLVDKNREKLKRVPKVKRIHKRKNLKKSNFRHACLTQKVSRVLPLENRNASFALGIASIFEVMSLRGTSST